MNARLEDINCGTRDRCLMRTGRNQLLLTEDGGASVRAAYPKVWEVRGVAFASSTRVVTGGRDGAMSTSDDGGSRSRCRRTDRGSFRLGLRLGPDAGDRVRPRRQGTARPHDRRRRNIG